VKKGASIHGSQKATGTPKDSKYRAKRGFASLFIQISEISDKSSTWKKSGLPNKVGLINGR
jgi:hypothetical protein